MAIMQSCCCWRSVRRGSFACAVYSGIYFTLLALTTGRVVQGESQYLKGDRTLPESTSFLESGTISPTTVKFNVMLLACSCGGVVCSLLLLYGLFKDQRVFLIPWIVAVITCSIVDVAHSMYLFIVASTFNPLSVMLYTLNFFLLCLNIYSLLCVISQYQEYVAGRGTAADDYEYRVPAVRYATQPTTTTVTSCLSSRRAATNNDTRVTATPTQSPTAGHDPERSPGTGRPARKHVQFPDTANQKENSSTACTLTVVTKQSKPGAESPSSPELDETASTVEIDQPQSPRENNGNYET